MFESMNKWIDNDSVVTSLGAQKALGGPQADKQGTFPASRCASRSSSLPLSPVWLFYVWFASYPVFIHSPSSLSYGSHAWFVLIRTQKRQLDIALHAARWVPVPQSPTPPRLLHTLETASDRKIKYLHFITFAEQKSMASSFQEWVQCLVFLFENKSGLTFGGPRMISNLQIGW